MFILLSVSEATLVRGPSSEAPKLSALQPIALTDGRFILGDEVLGDPTHAEHVSFLTPLSRTDLATITPLLPTFAGVSLSLGTNIIGGQ